MSLFIDIFLTEAYTYDEAERLVNAALNRLSAIGSVGVKTSESPSTSPFASTSTATPPTTTARIQGTSTTASPAPADPRLQRPQARQTPRRPLRRSCSPTRCRLSRATCTFLGHRMASTRIVLAPSTRLVSNRSSRSSLEAMLSTTGNTSPGSSCITCAKEYRDGPDDPVLDFVSGYTYSPWTETAERVTISGEQVLVRRTPNLAAWSWFDEGISFTVLANEIDPVEASNFVVALTAAQQAD